MTESKTTNPSPQQCYDAMKPVLDEIDRLIGEAPLDENARSGVCAY